MTTITIAENIDLGKTHFESLEELQMHLLLIQSESDLSPEHERILDQRLEESTKNPVNYLTIDQLKESIQRK